jgi:hypothetical protein
MSHLSPAHHETSKHDSLNETEITVKLPKCLEFKFKPRQVNDLSQSNKENDHLISQQPCLELCRFAQALLKTKVERWKAYFFIGNCEKTHMQHLSERKAYYSRYVTEKKNVTLGVL